MLRFHVKMEIPQSHCGHTLCHDGKKRIVRIEWKNASLRRHKMTVLPPTAHQLAFLAVCLLYLAFGNPTTVFILLQSAGSISRNTYFAAGTIGNLLNTAAGSIRMRVVL